jgi:hypothetical protein
MTLLRLIVLLSDYIIPQITSYILPCTHMYGMTHQKALKTGIIAAILLVAAILTTTMTTNVQASDDCRDKPFPQDIACGLGNAATGYDTSYSDGKNAGANGRSSGCPQSDSMSGYCLGWKDGYNDGSDARRDMEKETGGNNNDNDCGGSGTHEDDGEFENDNNNNNNDDDN